MPLENSIQKSYLSIDIALIAIYTIKYKKYFTHLKRCGREGSEWSDGERLREGGGREGE